MVPYQAVISALEVDLYNANLRSPSKRVAADALRNSLFKKFLKNDVVTETAQTAAINLFIENNRRCTYQQSVFEQPPPYGVGLVLDEFKDIMNRFWFCKKFQTALFGLHDLGRNMRPGPGASIGAIETDAFSKIADGPLTATDEDLYDLYRRLVDRYPLESEAECIRRIRFSNSDNFNVPGSRLSIVPKTTEIGRAICTEPSINMMLQLSCGKFLEDRLKSFFGIALETQPIRNSLLARYGSISGDFATIDLKSASDSISLALLYSYLPADLVRILNRLRSPSVRLPDGRWIRLDMVSTMGNGFTFPLQTAIFASLVLAVYRILGIKLIRGSKLDIKSRSASELFSYSSHAQTAPDTNFGVFGDDIIVTRQAFHLTCDALSYLGFTINRDKTFNEGNFRESCGHDYYHGINVRGVYCKRLDIMQDFYVLINSLNEWSAIHRIPLPLTVSYLTSKVQWRPIPRHCGMDSGIRVPLILAPTRRDENGSTRFKLYEAVQREYRPVVDRNPAGFLSLAIRGYVRNGKLIRRSKGRKYRLVSSVSPCWEYADEIDHRKSILLGQRWNTAVVENLLF